jgi:hypothetical protein
MLTNFIDKNTNGLNKLLDDLLYTVFGDTFESAYSRAATLTGNIKLDGSTVKAFGIDEIFEGEEVYIGKAELNILFAAMRFVKASLEWVTAYDWNTDLNFLKNGPLWDDRAMPLGSPKPANIPLRNNFFKDRNNGMMAKSKADFVKAIDDSVAAYNLWIISNDLPRAYKDTLNEYQWVKDGFVQLKTAINSGGTFYVKEHSKGTATYNNTSANAIVGINLGKFFTPGFLAIDKLIETTGTGNAIAPKFYGRLNDSSNWILITEKNQISSYRMIGFMYKSAPIREVLVTGFEDDLYDRVLQLFYPDLAEFVWDCYH